MPSAKSPAKPGKFKVPPADRAAIALLDEALGGRSELRPGQMFGCPGYFCGTKAVAVVFGEDVSITLPATRVESLIASEGYRAFVAGGKTMSGWMLIDTEQMSRLGTDHEIFDEAIACARAKGAATKKPAIQKKTAARKVATKRR